MVSFPNAKINLGLNITEKRADGFHNIETVFYPIPLSDMLEFVPSEKADFTNSGLEIDGPAEDNLVLKAYDLLAQDFDLLPMAVHLHKVIPFGAGLGGGSADAAFMLKMLNEDGNLHLSDDQLEGYARQLGSDCAFFVRNAPVFAYEKGDVFKPVELSLKGKHIVLVNPNIHVSTQVAYGGCAPQVPGASLQDLIELPVERWKDSVVNDFEATVFPKFPRIGEIKAALYAQGAVYAAMSGSGSTVFGIFDDAPNELSGLDDAWVWTGVLS